MGWNTQLGWQGPALLPDTIASCTLCAERKHCFNMILAAGGHKKSLKVKMREEEQQVTAGTGFTAAVYLGFLQFLPFFILIHINPSLFSAQTVLKKHL